MPGGGWGARGAMDNASDYGSEDSRFESWRARTRNFFIIIYTANLTTNTAASTYTLLRCGKVVHRVSTTLPEKKSNPYPNFNPDPNP